MVVQHTTSEDAPPLREVDLAALLSALVALGCAPAGVVGAAATVGRPVGSVVRCRARTGISGVWRWAYLFEALAPAAGYWAGDVAGERGGGTARLPGGVGRFRAGDVFDADVEFDMVDWPGRDKSRGIKEMARAWQESLAAWDDFRAEPTDLSQRTDTSWYPRTSRHVARAAVPRSQPRPRRLGPRPGRSFAWCSTGTLPRPSKPSGWRE